jgi:hypothetical protein
MKTFLIGCFFFVCVPLFGIEVSRSVSPNNVNIGDVLVFDIYTTYEDGVRLVTVPTPENFSGIEYRSHTVIKDNVDGIWEVTLRYELSFFETGEQLIPTQDLEFQRGDKLLTFTIPAKAVRVDSLLSSDPYEKVDLEGLLTPFSISISWGQYRRLLAYIAFAIVALVVACIFLLRWYRDRKRMVEIPLDPRSEGQKALDELDELRAAQYIKKHLIKQYYLELTDIVKRYFSVLCDSPISEMTSHESYIVLKGVLSDGHMTIVKQVFDLADLVKFAKFVPEEALHIDSFDNLRAVIVESMPRDGAGGHRS